MAPADILAQDNSEYLWTAIEDLADKVVKAINQRQEPIGLLNKLNQLLTASERIIAHIGEEKEKITKFYLQTIKPIIVSILDQKGVGNKELYLPAVFGLFEILIGQYYSRHISCEELASLIAKIYDFDSNLYKAIGDVRVCGWIALQKILEKPRDLGDWRYEIGPGSKIDAVKSVNLQGKFVGGWSKGEILEYNRGSQESLVVQFKTKSRQDVIKKIFPRDSDQIAPPNSFTKDDGWRYQLKTGDHVDAFDTEHYWYRSTIIDHETAIDEETGQEVTVRVQVAFRIYLEEGSKFDEKVGKNYCGWDARYDEWRNVEAPTIQRFNSVSRAYNNVGKSHMMYEFKEDDSGDQLADLLTPTVFCVKRSNSWMSYNFAVDAMNDFGANGGFDAIVALLQKQSISLKHLQHITDFLAKTVSLWHRQFATKFVPLICELIQSVLFGTSEKEAAEILQGQFQHAELNQTLKNWAKVSGRYFPNEVRNKKNQQINVKIGFQLLKTGKLEKRIQGMKQVKELVKTQKESIVRKPQAQEEFVELLRTNEVIEEVFGKRNHIQLIQRSQEVVAYLMLQEALTDNDLDLIWSATASDTQTRNEIYKVLSGAASTYHATSNMLKLFLIRKMSEISPKDFGEKELELVLAVGRVVTANSDYAKIASDLLWKIVIQEEGYKSILVEKALEKFNEFLRSSDKDVMQRRALECTQFIKQGKATVQCMKIITQIIETTPEITIGTGMTKKEFCKWVIEQETIPHILNDLQDYLKGFRALYLDGKIPKGAEIDTVIVPGSNYTHRQHVFLRISFISQLYESSKTEFVLESLQTLWQLLVGGKEDSETIEPDIFFTWLKGQMARKKLAKETVASLFESQVISAEQQSFRNMKKEGFDCLLQMFIQTNLLQGKVLSANSSDSEDFVSSVPPSELTGVQILWKLFEHSGKDKDITQKAITLLSRTYTSLTCEMEDRAQEFGGEFVTESLSRLKHFLETESDKEAKSSLTKLTVDMLRNFFQHSELNGNQGILSYAALERGIFLKDIAIDLNLTSKSQAKTIVFHAYQSMSVWDLKKVIAQVCDFSPLQISINRTGKELVGQHCNASLIGDLGVCCMEKLSAIKVYTQTKNAPLVNSKNEYMPNVKRIVETWFERYSDTEHEGEKVMGDEGFNLFMRETTASAVLDNAKLKQSKNQFTDGKTEYVTREQFLQFYLGKCIEKPDIVRTNFRAHQIGGDLKPLMAHPSANDPKENKDLSSLPRHTLAFDQQVFEGIFELLEQHQMEDIFTLLHSIRVNPKTFFQILTLKDRESLQAHLSQDKSMYRKFYSLKIIAHLFHEYLATEPEKAVVFFQESKSSAAPASVDKSPPKLDLQAVNQDPNNQQQGYIPPPPEGREVVGTRVGTQDQQPFIGPLAPPAPQNQMSAEQLKALKEKSQKQEEIDITKPILSDADLKWAIETGLVDSSYQDKTVRELKKEWLLNFVQVNGLQVLIETLRASNEKNQALPLTEVLKDKTENQFLILLLQTINTLVMAAFQANMPEDSAVRELQRKLSTAQDEKPAEEAKVESVKASKVSGGTQTNPETAEFNDGFQHLDDIIASELEKDGTSYTGAAAEQNKKTYSQESREDMLAFIKPLKTLLEGERADQVLESIDYSMFQNEILRTALIMLRRESKYLQMAQKDLIKQAMNLWSTCIVYKPQLLEEVFSREELSSFLVKDGLMNPDMMSRQVFKDAIVSICTELKRGSLSQSPLIFFINLLIDHAGITKNTKTMSKHYYELFEKLWVLYEESQDEKVLDSKSLLGQFYKNLQEHNSEETVNSYLDDHYVIGQVKMIACILKHEPSLTKDLLSQGVVEFLLRQCLFSFDVQPYEGDINKSVNLVEFKKQFQSKCMQSSSREAAYRLLVTICEQDDKSLEEILGKYWVQLVSKVGNPKETGVVKPPEHRSTYEKFIGMKNLGAICYMISMLQQFFHVKPFRYSLLAAKDKMPIDLQEFEGRQVDDNVLHQLKAMFSAMELSDRSFFNPKDFCFAFKDFSGQPINVRIQQDSQEFLNMLFDRLENLLSETSQKYLLQSVFGGKTAVMMSCKNCGFQKERTEDFYNLSLEVKDQKSVYTALEKFVQKDIVSDYECDGCKQKVELEKRNVLKALPNVLIIHLQRITFDFETMMNQKLNSRLEFPKILSLKDYMVGNIEKKEAQQIALARKQSLKQEDQRAEKMDEDAKEEEKKIEDDQEQPQMMEIEDEEEDEEAAPEAKDEGDEYEYKLIGVNVHMGHASAGHYLSYINTTRSRGQLPNSDPLPDEDDPKWAQVDKHSWSEFNDASCRSYIYSKLEGDCFGGGQENYAPAGFGETNNKNAYMLFYEKKRKSPLKVVVPENKEELYQPENPLSSLVPDLKELPVIIDEETKEHFIEANFNSVDQYVENEYQKQVHFDNQQFLFERQVLQQGFSNCTDSLIDLVTKRPQVAERLLKETEFGKFLEYLVFDFKPRVSEKEGVKKLVAAYEKLLGSSAQEVARLVESRVLVADNSFLLQTIKALDVKIRQAQAQILTILVNKLFETDQFELLDRIFDSFSMMIRNNELANNWLKVEQLLEFVYRTLISGEKQFEYLALKKDMCAQLLDFALGEDSPLCLQNEKRPKMGSEHANPPLEYLVLSVAHIVRNCEKVVQGGEEEDGPVSPFFLNTHGKSFPLSDTAVNLVFQSSFVNSQARYGHATNELGKYAAHLCFNNLQFSRDVAEKIVVGMNETNENNCQPTLDILQPTLSLLDKYSRQRYEWIVGIPDLAVKYQNSPASTVPQCGISYMQASTSNTTIYKSSLYVEANTFNECLLRQLFTNQRRYPKFILMTLETLYQIIVSEHECQGPLFDYINKDVPPPSYFYAKWTDWVLPFVQERLKICKEYQYNSDSNKRESELAIRVLSLLEEEAKILGERKQPEMVQQDSTEVSQAPAQDQADEDMEARKVPRAYQYIIWEAYDERCLDEQPYPEESCIIYDKEYTCKITSSNPVISKNTEIPEGLFTGYSSQRKSMRRYVNENLQDRQSKRGRRANQVPRQFRAKRGKKVVGREPVGAMDDEPMVEHDDYVPQPSSNQQDGDVPAVNIVPPEEEDKEMATEDVEMQDVEDVQEGEDELEHWDADLVCLRMICINNKEQVGTKHVRIKLKPSANANYFCPRTEIPTSINATYEKDAIILIKKDPFQPWGDFAFEPLFQQPEAEKSPEKPSEAIDVPMEYGDQPQARPFGTGVDDFPGLNEDMADAGGKSCPACTYNNFSTATSCEICGTKL